MTEREFQLAIGHSVSVAKKALATAGEALRELSFEEWSKDKMKLPENVRRELFKVWGK